MPSAFDFDFAATATAAAAAAAAAMWLCFDTAGSEVIFVLNESLQTLALHYIEWVIRRAHCRRRITSVVSMRTFINGGGFTCGFTCGFVCGRMGGFGCRYMRRFVCGRMRGLPNEGRERFGSGLCCWSSCRPCTGSAWRAPGCIPACRGSTAM